jgi:alcohol dehydrogenase (cytochrome c)
MFVSKKHVVFPCVLLLVLCVGSSAQVRTPDQTLINPDPRDWVTYGGTYDSHRYSQLKQVTTANASRLQAKWVYHLDGTEELEFTPIVSNGVIYVSGFNRVDALDTRTGNIIWKYQRQPPSAARQRGTAVYGDKVYVATSDSHLVALDARTGGVRWDVKSEGGYTISGGAPLVADGKVIVSGNRPNGFIQAFDAVTGKYAWTWSALPTGEDPAYATWGGATPAGVPIWVSGSFDPELNLIYYGTGQPDPQWTGVSRPGDNLYSDSIVALDVKSGTLKWHFQNTPHDVHDWDSLETPVLIDATFRGQPRKLLVQANRNGFVYVLDRTNGKFLSATRFVEKMNWAKQIDEQGRPIRTEVRPTTAGSRICPGYSGATNWYAPSYHESARMVYFMALEECETFLSQPTETFHEGKEYYSTGVKRIPGETSQKVLVAYSLDTGSLAWKYPQTGRGHSSGGTMTTAGGLVFFGDDAGSLEAVDARSGQPLWHFNTGQDMSASPMTYAVAGKQYVAIASGGNVFSFALP